MCIRDSAYLDQEVLGNDGREQRVRVELPWNDEVEAARRAEVEAAAKQTADDADNLQQDGPDEGTFGHIEPDELNDEPEESLEPVSDGVLDKGMAELSLIHICSIIQGHKVIVSAKGI